MQPPPGARLIRAGLLVGAAFVAVRLLSAWLAPAAQPLFDCHGTNFHDCAWAAARAGRY